MNQLLPREVVDQIMREEQHFAAAPQAFFEAWKRGVEIAGPEWFGDGTREGLNRANTKWDLRPDMLRLNDALGVLSSGERMFLSAMVSFYNAREGGAMLKRCHFHGLSDFDGLDLERRKVIADLLVNYSVGESVSGTPLSSRSSREGHALIRPCPSIFLPHRPAPTALGYSLRMPSSAGAGSALLERSQHGKQLLRRHGRSRARPRYSRHQGTVRCLRARRKPSRQWAGLHRQIAETNDPRWTDVLDGLENLATQLGIPMPDDEELSIPPLLERLAAHFGADQDGELENLIEHHHFEDSADLEALLLIATRFDDGHNLTAIQFEGCWYCSKPRLFEFGGNGCYLSREVQVFRTSSQALQLGDQLRNTILAADIEEASALIALEAANLLAGITDEQFRLNVRHRIAERLAQTSTISAD